MSFVSSISPQQQAQYQQGRANAGADYRRNTAANQYQQGVARQGYNDDLFGYNTQQNRVREGLPTNYIQRGVFRSGIYRNALRDYALARLQGEKGLANRYQQQMAGLTFQGRDALDSYSETMSNLYGNQYAAQAGIASVLKGLS